MKTACLAGAFAALAFVVPAFAQNTTAQDTGSAAKNAASNQSLSPHNQHIADRIRTDMQKAGFTNIQVMPESFLVRAKDSDGNPVMMVINPDSMTEVTALGTTSGNGSQNNTHSGAMASNESRASGTGSSSGTSGPAKP